VAPNSKDGLREEPMTIQQVPQDQWSLGHNYERYIGRWSRPVARQFVTWLALPPVLRWLDVGCGTGALTQAILKDCAPASVLGIDPSAGFIALARGQVNDARASFQSGTAQALPLASVSVDAVVSGLVLNFTPDPAPLRDRLRAMLPVAADGRIALTARALAVRGVRPES
jgi:SAM-dependent methyltransferase